MRQMQQDMVMYLSEDSVSGGGDAVAEPQGEATLSEIVFWKLTSATSQSVRPDLRCKVVAAYAA